MNTFCTQNKTPWAERSKCVLLFDIKFKLVLFIHLLIFLSSPAENKFDLELSSKVFFFTEFCSVDIAFEESE